jgi:RNase adapter protein RapZ
MGVIRKRRDARRNAGEAGAGTPGGDGQPAKRVDLVVITGYSGAGKSEAIAAFEDGGYFCVDNLPPRMIRTLGELFQHEGSGVERAAVVCDARGGEYFDDLLAVLDELQAAVGLEAKVMFLVADEQTLIDRYKETRRRHPLAPEGRVVDGIRAELEALGPLRERADVIIDTTGISGAALRQRISSEMLEREAPGKLALTILTFGFKHGPPRESDLVLDVRFLPNPYYVEGLRPLTGRDPEVIEYVHAGTTAGEFYGHLLPLLEFLVPAYVAEGKTHLTIAIGCTGGRHRSVCVADRIRRELAGRDDVLVKVVHRDVELEDDQA